MKLDSLLKSRLEKSKHLYGVPARKIVRLGNLRVVGRHYSQKMGTSIEWESRIEESACQLFEVDPEVIAYFAQPRKFKIEGRTYTPDFYVLGRTSSYFVEIKPDSARDDQEFNTQFDDFQSWFLKRGEELRLITKSDLLREPRSSTIQLLRRYLRSPVTTEFQAVLGKNRDYGSWSIQEFMDGPGEAHDWGQLLAAIARGYLSTDLDLPITEKSQITIF